MRECSAQREEKRIPNSGLKTNTKTQVSIKNNIKMDLEEYIEKVWDDIILLWIEDISETF